MTFGIVGTVNEVLDDRQMRDSGALVPFADGDKLTISSPFHIDGVDKVPAQRAPAIGQHPVPVAERGAAQAFGRQTRIVRRKTCGRLPRASIDLGRERRRQKRQQHPHIEPRRRREVRLGNRGQY